MNTYTSRLQSVYYFICFKGLSVYCFMLYFSVFFRNSQHTLIQTTTREADVPKQTSSTATVQLKLTTQAGVQSKRNPQKSLQQQVNILYNSNLLRIRIFRVMTQFYSPFPHFLGKKLLSCRIIANGGYKIMVRQLSIHHVQIQINVNCELKFQNDLFQFVHGFDQYQRC